MRPGVPTFRDEPAPVGTSRRTTLDTPVRARPPIVPVTPGRSTQEPSDQQQRRATA